MASKKATWKVHPWLSTKCGLRVWAWPYSNSVWLFCIASSLQQSPFRRWYQMLHPLFLRIMESICAHDPYFVSKRYVCDVLGLNSIKKCTSVLHMLTYGQVANAGDEYCKIRENTSHECLKCLLKTIKGVFELEFLKQLTQGDFDKQMKVNAYRGWLGMFASLDYVHYHWKNCHVAWQCFFIDKDGNKSIILEVIANQRLWIWHAYFDLPTSNNDLN